MRIFYQSSTSHLIIAPYRCGSTYLKDKSDHLGLTYLGVLGADGVYRDTITYLFNNKDISKTFIYRDPIERYISYYAQFVQPYSGENATTKKKILETTANKYADYIIQKDLLEEASKNNIWYNIHKGLSALEKNYTKDWHTNTLHSYFEYTNQKIENYNFVPWDSFAKWIFLIFKVKNDYKSKLKDDLSETTTSGLDIMKCIEIYTTLKSLYAVDYDKLSDLAQKL